MHIYMIATSASLDPRRSCWNVGSAGRAGIRKTRKEFARLLGFRGEFRDIYPDTAR